jgi:hypothetical protein
VLLLVVVGALVGLFVTTRRTQAPDGGGGSIPVITSPAVQTHQQQVLCRSTPAGAAYTYSEPSTNRPHCTNGAQPVIIGRN